MSHSASFPVLLGALALVSLGACSTAQPEIAGASRPLAAAGALPAGTFANGAEQWGATRDVGATRVALPVLQYGAPGAGLGVSR